MCVCVHKKTSRERQIEGERDRWIERLNILNQIGMRKVHSQNTFEWKGGCGERNVLSISIRSDWITLVKKRDLPALSQYVVLESADFAQFERFL